MLRVRPELALRQQYRPILARCFEVCLIVDQCRPQLGPVRIVAFEVGGIDFDFFDAARLTEPQYDPVVSSASTTRGLPAVSHVDAAAG